MSLRKQPEKVELLAPARDARIAVEAIKHGADAVYMGASSHGARSAAVNRTDDIARVVDFAHRFDAKVYVTVNTLIFDSELKQVERLVRDLYRIGVDALIVQDMALMEMDIPPIALHASTQCDIRDAAKAEFLEQAGFSQLVLARELGIEEIAGIHSRVGVPLEAFVHGALCVSYSGDCQAGYATALRSANRGECPQICRHSFDLIDSAGHRLVENKHLLSLKDLNRSARLAELIEAGVSSLKIEGRLKDEAYVKNVVAAYSRLLDDFIASSDGKYVRASRGVSEVGFVSDLNKSFNRGYTEYFTVDRRPQQPMASCDSPKWTGEEVGRVVLCSQRGIKARLHVPLANGDGLGYFDADRNFHGFRLNRVEGAMLYPAQPVRIPAGTPLYRNHDRLRADVMASDTGRRTIGVVLTLRATRWGIALEMSDSDGHSASATMAMELSPARTPQAESRREVLGRTGDTVYTVVEIDDRLGDIFVPRSALTSLRRRVIEVYERAARSSYVYDYHRRTDTDADFPRKKLTYHDNVANSLSETFYRRHGADTIEPALEKSGRKPAGDVRVMTTRYCLRRELGRCLRTLAGKEWCGGDMFLVSGNMRLRVEFDCAKCQMNVFTGN